MRTLKLAAMAIVLTLSLQLAVSQTVPPPPTMKLPRGCVYAYQPPLRPEKLPKEFAREPERALYPSTAQIPFQAESASDSIAIPAQHEKDPWRSWSPSTFAADISPWTVLCGLHGLNDGENNK